MAKKKKTEHKGVEETVIITGVALEIPETALDDLLKAMAEKQESEERKKPQVKNCGKN